MDTNEQVVYLYLDDIIPNRFQPREVFDEQPLKELAVSIKEHGVIQPIIVRRINDKYEIIAGERRYKASALAGLTKIPAIVRNLDDKETSKVALLENLQRKNLNPLEEARTYQKILEIDEMTQEELAKTMGKSQSSVANKIRLLSLPEDVQEALLKEQISERHARTLLNVKDPEKQKKLLQQVIKERISVRKLEEMIKNMNGENVLSNKEETIENKNINQNFVESTPLMPNFNENNPQQEPLIITPPTETVNMNNNEQLIEDKKEEPKFINFGEIDDDFNDDSNKDDILFNDSQVNAGTEVNINDLKNNTSDISSFNTSSTGVDLDSLLQVGKPKENEQTESDTGFKFFSPAEEALKDSEENNKPSEGDYFKAPELINVDLPNSVSTLNTNNVPLSDTFNVSLEQNNSQINVDSTENNINKAISIIREALDKVQATGLKIEKDEMNLEKSYQIIIKIDKN